MYIGLDNRNRWLRTRWKWDYIPIYNSSRNDFEHPLLNINSQQLPREPHSWEDRRLLLGLLC